MRVVGKGLAELLSGPGGRGVRRYIDMQDAPLTRPDSEWLANPVVIPCDARFGLLGSQSDEYVKVNSVGVSEID